MAPLVSTGAACGLSAPSSLADVGLLLHAQLSCHRERQLKQQLAGCSGDGKWQGTAQPWQRLLWVLPPQLCLAPRPSQANVRVAAGAASTLGVCQLFASSWVPAQRGDAWQECAISPLCLQVHFPSGRDTNAGKRLQAPYVGRESTLFVCYSSRKLSRSLTPRTPQ